MTRWQGVMMEIGLQLLAMPMARTRDFQAADGDILVAARLAVRNLAQRFPDFQLGQRGRIQRQIEFLTFAI